MPRVSLPITTPRLTLRSFRPGDEEDVFAYRSVPSVVRYIPGEPKTREDVADLVAERATAGRVDERSPILTLAVELDGRVIGDVLIHLAGLGGADGRQAEIGWVFAPDLAGQGYATEAARALLEAAFGSLGVHRVWAQLEPENTPSSRICERLGMRREALFEKASWFKEQWTDLAIYALLADEWSAGTTSSAS
ncbi:RimJ/RimL family protein N-acetyltransferase [Phycicoccus badiiscoriae]|uniref:RimJ/RimL family protein N-acetyltransferase n=1 Tax=Pedococcus badiiscoriae TaxID=642776 RepID=A0A852WP95_9MICO|nr:GNAT family protein [Pedococcus badiiscoriae]NYG08055.1 RimJ/RimL family protein N-acetyltransferase [Pedococcus badiiscoriae]